MGEKLKLNWDLEVMYKSFDDEKFHQDLAGLKEAINGIIKWTDENFRDPADPVPKLEYYLNFMNDMNKFSTLSSFVSLTLSVDATNMTAMKYDDILGNLYANMATVYTLFDSFVAGIENLDDVINQSDVLKTHSFILNESKQQGKHRLSEKEEALFAKLQTVGTDAFSTLMSQLTATLMIDVEVKGEKKRLPLSGIRNLAYDANPETRKAAYEAEIAAYERVDKSIAMALNCIKGEAIMSAKMRGYESVLDMTLQAQRLEKSALDAMLEAIREALPSVRRFFKKKAEMLGHQGGLPYYDLFAPVGEVEMTFSYEEAAEFVVKNFSAFSEQVGQFARNAFDNAWIDVMPKEGKVGGAFCASIKPLKQSRILANFDGSYSDVTTLAHELGHGYHNECLKDQCPMNTRFSAPIAETASNFCETIVEYAALDAATKEQQVVILENSLTSMTGVIVDIYSRFLFEDELIRRREEGPLSVGELKDLMLWAEREAYGDGFTDVLHPYMWACKSHYYNAGHNYYNYPYAYGMLFAKGLYAQYLEEGDSFLPKYNELLASTGQKTLAQVAEAAGINVSDIEFWRKSLKIVESFVDRFCAL